MLNMFKIYFHYNPNFCQLLQQEREPYCVPNILIHRHNYIIFKISAWYMSPMSQLQQRRDFLRLSRSLYESLATSHTKRSVHCVTFCINFNESWAQTCTKNTKKKIQDTALSFIPTLFHFASWKVYTVVTSCIPRETANQSAINLSVCMFARIHRVNKGSGTLMRCAVTSQAWFHSNYWGSVTVIRIPVDWGALTVLS
jgi:hypothetical protein